MFRIIHPNRWFFWTIAALVATGLGLLFLINKSVQEFEQQALDQSLPSTQLLSDPSYLGWKQFRSATLGIAVKYPPSWQIEINRDEPNTLSFENPKNFSENITVSVTKPELEKVIRNSLKIASEENLIVDGIDGVLIKGAGGQDKATSHVVLVESGGKLYYIAGYSQVFEKIIAGIKFLSAK